MRSGDHVLLGVSWSGLAPSGTRPDGLPVLKAASDDARLVLTFPPQHVAEEALLRDQLPVDTQSPGSGPPVPVWSAMLSGPSRLALHLPRGTTLVPTVEGVLRAASLSEPLRPGSPPGAMETALELPWRMIFSVEDRQGGLDVASLHPALPVTLGGVTGLWRARLAATRPESGTLAQDAALALRAVDTITPGTPDPAFPVPLDMPARSRLATEAKGRPARATRLELSSLGGTLTALGQWKNAAGEVVFQWEHDAVLGRDVRVRTVTSGVLYPLGHRATYVELSERTFHPAASNAATLRSKFVLTVTEPVRHPPPEGRATRAFPFGDVEITTLAYPDLVDAAWEPFEGRERIYFLPTRPAPASSTRRPVLFPVRCGTPDGDLQFELPLVFVSDIVQPGFTSLTDTGLADRIEEFYLENSASVPIPGVSVDLVRAPARKDGDIHEVHGITVGGTLHPTGYRPRLTALEVRLPALRTLLGTNESKTVTFAEAYLEQGASQDVLLTMIPPQDITFVGNSDRSGGLVAPHMEANALSRTRGPVDTEAVPAPGAGLIDPAKLFGADATLLGFPLKDLITELEDAPQITAVPQPGSPPAATMTWTDVKLKASGPFVPGPGGTLNLKVTTSADGTDTSCEVRDFALVLPVPSKPLVRLQFGSLSYTHTSGGPPRIDVGSVDVTFLGELQLVQELGEAVALGDVEPYIDVTRKGLVARYSLPVPSVTSGAFVMRDVAVNTRIEVPFDGRPVSLSLGFASQQNPFRLAVLMFGGGGYLELEVNHKGLQRLEAALEFGATMAVDFVVARGEVHAFGGVRFELTDNKATITGYLRIGGCVEILGLVSVSIELCISLAYQTDTKALVGRATLVIEIDLTLWSDSIELDSGTWVLAGGGRQRDRRMLVFRAPDEGLERWRAYQAAFAPVSTGDQ
ncbi:hypothetical protein ACIGW1_31895 [Streptomyces sp. NPDC053780]|uniref:hypothetical protein n=1 Tax=unclassified Streptomyces TaxID=2593676 RepID=UPI0034235B0F